ncbi:unnamed protein product [Meganyctiphanes norvegica]|uniref:Uncharacterized protein n=1 Tax=Meganyctiphanes norvegica TaxID=48144 RepID=A0AAV2QYN8_MEGNR
MQPLKLTTLRSLPARYNCDLSQDVKDWELVDTIGHGKSKILNIYIFGDISLKLHSVCMEAITVTDARRVITYHDEVQGEQSCGYQQKLHLKNTKSSDITRDVKYLHIQNSENQNIRMEKPLEKILIKNSSITIIDLASSSLSASLEHRFEDSSVQNVKNLSLIGDTLLVMKKTDIQSISEINYNSTNTDSIFSYSSINYVETNGIKIFAGKITFDNVNLSNLQENSIAIEDGANIIFQKCILDNVGRKSIYLSGGSLTFNEVAFKGDTSNKTFSFTLTNADGLYPMGFTGEHVLAGKYTGIGIAIGIIIGVIVTVAVFILYTKFIGPKNKYKSEENGILSGEEFPSMKVIENPPTTEGKAISDNHNELYEATYDDTTILPESLDETNPSFLHKQPSVPSPVSSTQVQNPAVLPNPQLSFPLKNPQTFPPNSSEHDAQLDNHYLSTNPDINTQQPPSPSVPKFGLPQGNLTGHGMNPTNNSMASGVPERPPFRLPQGNEPNLVNNTPNKPNPRSPTTNQPQLQNQHGPMDQGEPIRPPFGLPQKNLPGQSGHPGVPERPPFRLPQGNVTNPGIITPNKPLIPSKPKPSPTQNPPQLQNQPVTMPQGVNEDEPIYEDGEDEEPIYEDESAYVSHSRF